MTRLLLLVLGLGVLQALCSEEPGHAPSHAPSHQDQGHREDKSLEDPHHPHHEARFLMGQADRYLNYRFTITLHSIETVQSSNVAYTIVHISSWSVGSKWAQCATIASNVDKDG